MPEQASGCCGSWSSVGSGNGRRSPTWWPIAAPIEIVGRFLALLELYRSRAVAFDQSEPLGVLQVSWTGEQPTSENRDILMSQPFDADVSIDMTETDVPDDPSSTPFDLGIDVATAPELEDGELGSVLEALLLVVDTPVTVDALATATEQPAYRVAAKLQ